MRAVTARGPASIFIVCIAAGLVIGTMADRIPVRSPITAGEYVVLVGDFHVHAFPGDGSLAPWTLRHEAARAGLDVFAVTNHNRVFTSRFSEWLASYSDGPLVIAGEEVTNPGYHLIGVGVKTPVDAFQPAATAIDDIHAQGGVAIAAHPGPRATGYGDDAIARLDGSELAHSAMHESVEFRVELANFFQRVRAVNPDVAPIGSSDFHVSPALARCRTVLFARERTREGVLEAIRHGRTVAMDGDGRLYGDPNLVRLVDRASLAGRSDAHTVWRRLSIALSGVGVLGLVLFRKPGFLPSDGNPVS